MAGRDGDRHRLSRGQGGPHAAVSDTRGSVRCSRRIMKQPSIEVLSFEGCPNRDEAVRLVRRVADELALEPRIQLIDVPDPEAAIRERFLGSPTIRVDGRDIEPEADRRSDCVYACRIYR